LPETTERNRLLRTIQSKLAGQHTTLADDTPPRQLRPGDKASIHVKKRAQYIPVTITEERWDAHGNRYLTANHATQPWAVELPSGRFIPGWPDGTKQQPADDALTARARQVFLDTGVLRAASVPAQLARAIANSLWPHLKRQRWQQHTVTRDLAAYNPSNAPQIGPRGFRTTPSAVTSVVQHHEEWIAAMLYAKEWFGDDGLPADNYAILLTRGAHDTAVAGLEPADRYALAAAYASKAKAPFRKHPNRHGVPRLRRDDYECAMTSAAAAALEAIAAAAFVVPVSECAVDAFHSGDIDLYPDLVSSVPKPVTHVSAHR
jgi:hypothetical protein